MLRFSLRMCTLRIYIGILYIYMCVCVKMEMLSRMFCGTNHFLRFFFLNNVFRGVGLNFDGLNFCPRNIEI